MKYSTNTFRLYLDECPNPECSGVAVFSSVWNFPNPIMHTTVNCPHCDFITLKHNRLETDINHVPNVIAAATNYDEPADFLYAYTVPDCAPKDPRIDIP